MNLKPFVTAAHSTITMMATAENGKVCIYFCHCMYRLDVEYKFVCLFY
jgi:hypothetical protein